MSKSMIERLWQDIKLRTGGFMHPGRASKRGYNAAVVSRLNYRWITANLTSDNELRKSLALMRSRSRDLEQNNDYVKKFLYMLDVNVIGHHGIRLQNKAKNIEGVLDTGLNNKIEQAFKKWTKDCTVDGINWKDAQKMFIKGVARDGEILVRKVRGYKNDFGFALQFIEPDHLDEKYNEDLANGNRIIMGVEKDGWGRAVAYHISTRHPGDYSYMNYRTYKLYDRIPAEEIIHAYIKERPTQSRGVPWLHTAVTRLNMLGGIEEAELVATRTAACKMGFFEEEGGDAYEGDAKDSLGNTITEAEPGAFERLPAGVKLQSYDPQHPNTALPQFMKSMLRGVASGINVSYNSLASDRESVNFSSLRHGEIQDRDGWKTIQGWTIDHLCTDVFDAWLPMAILTGQLDLPTNDIEKISNPVWRPRGFDWVDPQKDITADIMAIKNGFKTLSQVIAERGEDIEDVLAEQANDIQLIKKYGLKIDFSASLTDKEKKPVSDEDTDDEEALKKANK